MYREYLKKMGCAPSTDRQTNKTFVPSHRESFKNESDKNSNQAPSLAETKKETPITSKSGELAKVETKTTPSEPSKPEKTEPETKMSKEQKAKAMKDLDDLRKQSDDLMEMIKETMAVLENSVKNDPIFQGNVSKEILSPAKIIRIFTSSTFTDTKYERNRMMETTYPHLKAYCQQKGFEFQIVDMRWGIRDEATNDHMTTEICLQEIANCQKYSAGPNFLSLLSHKYGYRSLPRQITAEDFEKILGHIDITHHRGLLTKWYKKDENCVPHKYFLQPISTHLPDFVTKDDKDRQAKAKKQWWDESDIMLEALILGAEKALPQEEAYKFKLSVTHTEIMSGVLKTKQDVAKKCVWVRRNITNIDQQPPSQQLSRFTECNGPDEKIQVIRQLMNDLRKDMTERLPEENILTYEVSWQEQGLDPSIQEHNAYLEKICEDSEKKLKQLVDGIIAEDQKRRHDPIREESKQHLLFCQGKIADFQGKEDTLKIVEEYVKGKSPYPLVIHGASGSGKTSLMAMIAKKSFEWMNGKGTVVIRFLGTTPASSNLFMLLKNLVAHIRCAKNMDMLKFLNKVTEASIALKGTLLKVKDPLVLILDSLDQLDPSLNARELAWLPTILNGQVKVIVSTLEEPQYESFPALQAKLKPECFVPVTQISIEDVRLILNHWLTRKERTLTQPQFDLILESFKQCPLPLYLNLCFLQAQHWPSYLEVSNIQLFKTVREAIHGLFTKMETLHGKIFVSRAFGYLTAAKIGLTESELEDILACDDDVLNDVYVYWTPPVRRLPPLLLARLRHDLQQYLVERGADGVTVIYWYHRQFIEAARERYCQEESSTLHSGLADFFLGVWAKGNKKEYVNRAGEHGSADRHVMDQPIKFGIKYNLRKLDNLAYHLAKSDRYQELKSECLLSPEYLMARLMGTSLRALVEDFETALSRKKDDQLDLVLQAIHLSEDALIFAPSQFVPQMLLRLHGQKDVQSFLESCEKSNTTYLFPDTTNLVKVGGPLVYALGGHKSQVDWVDMKKDGRIVVTAASDDHTVGLWDIKEGRLIRMLEQLTQNPNEVYFVCNDSLLLIYDSNNLIIANELGSKKHIIKHSAVQSFCLCGQDKDLLVCFTKANTVIVYDMNSGQIKNHIKPFENLSAAEKKAKKFGLFASGACNYAVTVNDDEHILWVVDLDQNTAYCSDHIKFPQTKAMEDCDEEDITIDAFAVSPNGKHLILSNLYDNIPYLLDIKTFEMYGKLQGGEEGGVLQDLKFSLDGKKMYAKKSENVIGIDLETGKQEVVVCHSSTIDCVASVDMKTFVTVSSDCILRVWDSTRKEAESINEGLPALKCIRSLTNCPNGRYLLLLGQSDKADEDWGSRICLYDIYKKQIVSQARYEKKMNISNITFISDWKFVAEVRDTSSKEENASNLQIIDLETMTATAIPGKAYRDLHTIAKVNYGKELLLPTRSGKNLKFYNVQTLREEHILNLPPEFGKRLGSFITTNVNGTLAVMTDSENEHIITVDVEERSIKSMHHVKDLNLEYIGYDCLVAADKSFFVFLASKKGTVNDTMFLWNWNKDKLLALSDVEMLKKKKGGDNGSSNTDKMILLNDDTIFSCHDDLFFRVWETRTGNLLKRLVGPRSSMSDLYSTPQSPYILTYSKFEEQTLFVWNKMTFTIVASFKLDESVDNVSWCEDGLSFVTVNRSKEALVTRWMLCGKDLPQPKDDFPQKDMSAVPKDQNLTFKQIQHDSNDLDQEDECPESDYGDDDDDDDFD